jgi:hypothetical protein
LNLTDLHPLAGAVARDLAACLAAATDDRTRRALRDTVAALDAAATLRELTRCADSAFLALGRLSASIDLEHRAAHHAAKSGEEHAAATRAKADALHVVTAATCALGVLREALAQVVEASAARVDQVRAVDGRAESVDPWVLVMRRDALVRAFTQLGVCAKRLRALGKPGTASDLLAWFTEVRGAENVLHHAEALTLSCDAVTAWASDYMDARAKLDALRCDLETIAATSFAAVLASSRAVESMRQEAMA